MINLAKIMDTDVSKNTSSLKIHIEGTREKVIKTLEVNILDEERLKEIAYRVFLGVGTKKENIYIRSLQRDLGMFKFLDTKGEICDITSLDIKPCKTYDTI